MVSEAETAAQCMNCAFDLRAWGETVFHLTISSGSMALAMYVESDQRAMAFGEARIPTQGGREYRKRRIRSRSLSAADLPVRKIRVWTLYDIDLIFTRWLEESVLPILSPAARDADMC
jgi:hypothetical protein